MDNDGDCKQKYLHSKIRPARPNESRLYLDPTTLFQYVDERKGFSDKDPAAILRDIFSSEILQKKNVCLKNLDTVKQTRKRILEIDSIIKFDFETAIQALDELNQQSVFFESHSLSEPPSPINHQSKESFEKLPEAVKLSLGHRISPPPPLPPTPPKRPPPVKKPPPVECAPGSHFHIDIQSGRDDSSKDERATHRHILINKNNKSKMQFKIIMNNPDEERTKKGPCACDMEEDPKTGKAKRVLKEDCVCDDFDDDSINIEKLLKDEDLSDDFRRKKKRRKKKIHCNDGPCEVKAKDSCLCPEKIASKNNRPKESRSLKRDHQKYEGRREYRNENGDYRSKKRDGSREHKRHPGKSESRRIPVRNHPSSASKCSDSKSCSCSQQTEISWIKKLYGYKKKSSCYDDKEKTKSSGFFANSSTQKNFGKVCDVYKKTGKKQSGLPDTIRVCYDKKSRGTSDSVNILYHNPREICIGGSAFQKKDDKSMEVVIKLSRSDSDTKTKQKPKATPCGDKNKRCRRKEKEGKSPKRNNRSRSKNAHRCTYCQNKDGKKCNLCRKRHSASSSSDDSQEEQLRTINITYNSKTKSVYDSRYLSQEAKAGSLKYVRSSSNTSKRKTQKTDCKCVCHNETTKPGLAGLIKRKISILKSFYKKPCTCDCKK